MWAWMTKFVHGKCQLLRRNQWGLRSGRHLFSLQWAWKNCYVSAVSALGSQSQGMVIVGCWSKGKPISGHGYARESISEHALPRSVLSFLNPNVLPKQGLGVDLGKGINSPAHWAVSWKETQRILDNLQKNCCVSGSYALIFVSWLIHSQKYNVLINHFWSPQNA